MLTFNRGKTGMFKSSQVIISHIYIESE